MVFVGDQCGNAKEAARFYTTIFEHSRVGDILRYGEAAILDKANMIQMSTSYLKAKSYLHFLSRAKGLVKG